ncbi:Rieske 2Fe-2S domain-containing protein [Nocardia colli]|uniref:Rieske 2Fe-2S domain-containing protein n=1 Tax=Nocardia colli TaxID=2545717 RepID=UPI00168CAD9D|nr:Rieske 2Fe-2S domain-containing protein [Nocardia colli]
MKRLESPPETVLRPRRPYANGWFVLGSSKDVAPGKIRTYRFVGEDVVVFRTRKGILRASGAYCPHLGAHLGYGGRVDGECVVCPFHGFAYDTTGACVRTGYGTPPPKAALSLHTVREVNGFILIWYHAEGAEPTWEIPPLPDDFPAQRRHDVRLREHPQEVTENLVDLGHFLHVHNFSAIAQVRPMEIDGPHLRYEFEGVNRTPRLFGIRERLVADVYGLGYIAVHFTLPDLHIRGRAFALSTPTDPTHVVYSYGASLMGPGGNGLPARLVTRLFVPFMMAISVPADYPMWNNKTFLEHPRLAKGDGPIIAFRRWAKQFYSAETGSNGQADAGSVRTETVQFD